MMIILKDKHWWRIGLVLCIVLGLLVAIGLTQEEVKNPSTLIEAIARQPETLDPAFAYDPTSIDIIANVYEPLISPLLPPTSPVSVGEFLSLLYKLQPRLATEVPSQENGLISVAADGRTYVTFPIREGVTFQNGDPLTPEDVAYSFERDFIQDRSGGPIWILLEPILGVDTFDEFVENVAEDLAVEDLFNKDLKAYDATKPETYTDTMEKVDLEAFKRMAAHFHISGQKVTITLEKPAGYFLATLVGSWGSIVDKDWVASVGGWDGSADTWRFYHNPKKEEDVLFDKMNGTGPFKLERWEKGDEIVFVRNDNYWNKDKMPKIERVVIKKVDESVTRLLMLQEEGEADIIDPPPMPTDLPLDTTLDINEGIGTVNYIAIPTLQNLIEAAFFNFHVSEDSQWMPQIGDESRPDFFADIHVRKAFNYSFSWDTYLREVFQGEAIQPNGPIPRGTYYPLDIPTYSFDPKRAAKEFRLAWDGQLWERGFRVACIFNEGNDARRLACEILKANIESINPKFHITVQAEDWPQYLDDLVAGNLPMFILGWLEDYHDANNWVNPFMASTGVFSGFQGETLIEYAKEHWDPRIDKAATSLDPAERMEIYHQLEMDYYDQAPSILLSQPMRRHYQRGWVGGWIYNPAYPGAIDSWWSSIWKGVKQVAGVAARVINAGECLYGCAVAYRRCLSKLQELERFAREEYNATGVALCASCMALCGGASCLVGAPTSLVPNYEVCRSEIYGSFP